MENNDCQFGKEKKMKLKDRIKYNRYAWGIYQDSKKLGGIARISYIIRHGVQAVFLHKFHLWDYENVIRDNDFIIELKNKRTKLYVPYCKTDCLQMTIARDEDYMSRKSLDYLRKKYIKDGWNILDIGGNIGKHTIYFALECKANSVYTFEPQDDIFKILEKNIGLNSMGSICTAYHCGLGSENGNAKIFAYDKDNIGGTQLAMDSSGGIEVRRLDDFHFQNINFIKIDVEGFEFDVIKGAKELLTSQSPIIYCEIYDDKYEKVTALLKSYGYEVKEKVTPYDYVFVKKNL